MICERFLLRNVILLGLALFSFTAFADEWALPTIETYYSPDHRVRFTVTPRDIFNQLAYFEGKLAHRRLAGQRPGSTKTIARGTLEQLGRNGRWVVRWGNPLLNDVAPVSTLVADSAHYVVTFDNWHAMGGGKNVVVIYDAKGAVVRSLSLNDFLPDYYIKALPRSVSSIWWGGKHRISNSDDVLILKVVIPSHAAEMDKPKYVDVGVQLSTGHVLPSVGGAWQNALAEASSYAKIKQAADDAWNAAFRAPLLGPATTDEGDWHHYLQEAFFRSDPKWEDDYPGTTVLRSPSAKDYGPSETWVRDALLEKDSPASVLMFASPSSPDNLVKVLRSVAHDVKPNALRNARIYVAVPEPYREHVADALERFWIELTR